MLHLLCILRHGHWYLHFQGIIREFAHPAVSRISTNTFAHVVIPPLSSPSFLNGSQQFASPALVQTLIKSAVPVLLESCSRSSCRRTPVVIITVLLLILGSLVSEASHPRIPSGEFKGVITAIHPQSITVKGPRGTREFVIKTGEYSFEAGPGYVGLGERGVTRTQINSSIAIDLNPADVFKVGDQVTVLYWPTLNQGKEAGDIGYSDLEKLRAWNKANKARIKSE